jgi:hypothetical protein
VHARDDATPVVRPATSPGCSGPCRPAVVVTAATGGRPGRRRLRGRLGAPSRRGLALSPLLVGTVAVNESSDSILVVALAHTAVRMGGGTRGSGESSPQPGRTVGGTAADVRAIRAIRAELGIERLVTWGHSGGGPARAGVRRPVPGSDDGRRRACFAAPVRRRRPCLRRRHGPEPCRSHPAAPHRRSRRPVEAGQGPGGHPRRVAGRSGQGSRVDTHADRCGPPRRGRRVSRLLSVLHVLSVLHAEWAGAGQPGMVGRQLHAQAGGIRPRRHRRPGPAPVRRTATRHRQGSPDGSGCVQAAGPQRAPRKAATTAETPKARVP